MKTLKQLLYGLSYDIMSGDFDESIWVRDIETDSRRVVSGAMFVAIEGIVSDGHLYIGSAIGQGARIILAEKAVDATLLVTHKDVLFLRVRSTKSCIPVLCQNYFINKSEKQPRLIGVTGTNGKTSTAFFFYQMCRFLGHRCGLISTVENRIGDDHMPSTHTTPDIVSVYRLLSLMAGASCDFVVMEVSSHALDQGRVEGLAFDVAIFTNITHDHLDYHHTFHQYILAKQKLFSALGKGATAITNMDDRNSSVMLDHCVASRRVSFALRSFADYKGRIRNMDVSAMTLEINGVEVMLQVSGEFVAYNIMAAVAALCSLGCDLEEVLIAASGATSVPGRMQIVRGRDGRVAIVDYAHTPDAMEKVLSNIRKMIKPTSKILCVVGCGGDRDRDKRPMMAAIAAELADLCVFTTDNPRTENPQSILDQMKGGLDERVDNAYFVENRGEAIAIAVRLAAKGDVILIAGKGHEKYQEIQGHKYPFDDVEMAKKYLELQNS